MNINDFNYNQLVNMLLTPIDTCTRRDVLIKLFEINDSLEKFYIPQDPHHKQQQTNYHPPTKMATHYHQGYKDLFPTNPKSSFKQPSNSSCKSVLDDKLLSISKTFPSLKNDSFNLNQTPTDFKSSLDDKLSSISKTFTYSPNSEKYVTIQDSNPSLDERLLSISKTFTTHQ